MQECQLAKKGLKWKIGEGKWEGFYDSFTFMPQKPRHNITMLIKLPTGHKTSTKTLLIMYVCLNPGMFENMGRILWLRSSSYPQVCEKGVKVEPDAPDKPVSFLLYICRGREAPLKSL